PTTSGSWWFWGATWKSWSQWQALPEDLGSTLQLSSAYTGGSSGTTGGPDTARPVVSISNPPESATVSGTITVVVNASDNVGVTSVQFRVDGVAVGSELHTSPFNVSWNTTAFG